MKWCVFQMIKIICVGKIKEKYLDSFIEDYKTRISAYHKIEIIELKDSNIELESKEILSRINDKDFNIIMDIKGKKYDSGKQRNFTPRQESLVRGC